MENVVPNYLPVSKGDKSRLSLPRCQYWIGMLVQPYCLGNHPLTQKFYAFLSTYPNLNWVPVSLEVADRAAEFGARYNLSTPDPIQLATAIGF